MTSAADLLPGRNHRYAAPDALDLLVFPEELGGNVIPEFLALPDAASE